MADNTINKSIMTIGLLVNFPTRSSAEIEKELVSLWHRCTAILGLYKLALETTDVPLCVCVCANSIRC